MLNATGNYLAYLRKSRSDLEAESRGEGETLARHEHILFDLAKRLHISIKACYREIVSGESIAARPQMTRLLSEVEQGCWDGVLVVEVERLARGDTIDQGIVAQAFKYSDTKIITPTKIYDPANEFDEEYFEFGLFMSRREYKTINRRLQRGREQSVKEGKYIGNVAPYGYERLKLPGEKGYTLTPCSPQSDVVKQIYTWFAFGDGDGPALGITKIKHKLNALNIPAPKGPAWTDSSVHNILQNPVYNGKIRHKYRSAVKSSHNGTIEIHRPRTADYQVYPGLHPAIIPEDLFQAASKRLYNKAKRPVPTKYIVRNPLSGLIFCARCGKKMERRPYPNGLNDMLICVTAGCPTVGSPLFLVEQKVLESLSQIIHAELNMLPKQEHSAESLLEGQKALLQESQKELSGLLTQQDKLYDFLEKGIYSTEVFLERSEKLKEKRKQAELACQKASEEIEKAAKRLAHQKSFIPKTQYLLENYSQFPAEEQNRLLKELIDHIDYRKDTRNKRGDGNNATFRLHLFPRLMEH